MNVRVNESDTQRRQTRLLAVLESRGVEGLIVSHLPNIFYLTGFSGTAGLALFTSREKVLWVDGRYRLQARQQVRSARVVVVQRSPWLALARFLNRGPRRRIGVESQRLRYGEFLLLRKELRKRVELVPLAGAVEELRERKDPSEIDRVREACRLSVNVLTQVREILRPGVQEREVAAEIDYRLRREGADGVAFATIVASGPRSALPHGVPSERRIGKNELVLIDLGAILNHYCGDMTRTLFLGKADSQTSHVYERVREAQQNALDSLHAGVPAKQVDQAARSSLRREGLDRAFAHSTGHGVGLEIHEAPRLARGVESRLPANSVVTVEPGVYWPDWGGIRIEDTVLVGEDGPEILTPADKDDWLIG